jgi:glutaminyl-tRNA synthetase
MKLTDAKLGKTVQFERQGYFTRDTTEAGLVFNRTVGLRDTRAKS